jgi:hypothetical protein
MRRALIVAAALAALVAVPTGAAASFTGVTVAKDAKRKAAVVVSGRLVRTVRAQSRFAGLRVGQQITVRGSRLGCLVDHGVTAGLPVKDAKPASRCASA